MWAHSVSLWLFFNTFSIIFIRDVPIILLISIYRLIICNPLLNIPSIREIIIIVHQTADFNSILLRKCKLIEYLLPSRIPFSLWSTLAFVCSADQSVLERSRENVENCLTVTQTSFRKNPIWVIKRKTNLPKTFTEDVTVNMSVKANCCVHVHRWFWWRWWWWWWCRDDWWTAIPDIFLFLFLFYFSNK